MATAAPTQSLPLFYNSIEPLNLEQHGKLKVRRVDSVPEFGRTHAVPLTVDEFTLVQRNFPIVFSVGGGAVPIGLMGLNEGVNVFLDENGRSNDPNIYIPAYGEVVYTLTYEAKQAAQAWFKLKMTADCLGERPMQTEKAVEITGGR